MHTTWNLSLQERMPSKNLYLAIVLLLLIIASKDAYELFWAGEKIFIFLCQFLGARSSIVFIALEKCFQEAMQRFDQFKSI